MTVARATLRLIERSDLLAALDRAAASKVTIISAPAGSGKTSLLRAWAGVKAHLDTVTERGRAHHREIHRVLAAVDIEVFITTTTFAAGHRSFPVLKVPAAGSGVPRR